MADLFTPVQVNGEQEPSASEYFSLWSEETSENNVGVVLHSLSLVSTCIGRPMAIRS